MAGVAGDAQLRDLVLESLLGLGAARLVGDLRRILDALVEIRKADPDLRRRIGVAAGIAIDVGLPLIGGWGKRCGNAISITETMSA